MTLVRTGYGAGGHDFPEQANVLRVILGEPTGAEEALAVSVIEANIDDLNPQVLAYATERLLECRRARCHARSRSLMKKGRPGNLLRVIARPGASRSRWRRSSSPRPPRWACASTPPSAACRRAPGSRWKRHTARCA